MDKIKLKCLTKTHDGLIYKEWRGETEFHYVVIRDVLTEIQFSMAERENEAVYSPKTVFQKAAACFWPIKLVCDNIGLTMPEDYFEG